MNMKRITAALLAALTVAALASCGGGETAPAASDPAATGASETAEAAEETAAETAVPEKEYDFGGAEVSILYRNVSNLPDYEMTAELTGDVVDDAVYNRNLAVAEKLNVVLTFDGQGSAAADALPDGARSAILAGEAPYSIVVWGQTRMVAASIEGLFSAVTDEAALNLSEAWWNTPYIESLNLQDRVILLAGDVLITDISRMSSLFVGTELYKSLYGDVNELYDQVLDGGWTLDKYAALVEGAYSDLNGDGTKDIDDRYGMMPTATSNTDHFAYCAGLNLLREEGGTLVPDVVTDRNVRMFDELLTLYYENTGTFIAEETELVDGTAENRFASEQTLFLAMWFAATDRLRTMDTDYGVLPFPMLDEEQDGYSALIQNTASIAAIPVTNSAEDCSMAAAVLECMSRESRDSVLPAYYEAALKNKYTRDVRSAQMIDLIYSAASSNFAYCHSVQLGNVGTIARTILSKRQELASTYASLESKVVAGLEELLG